MSDTKSKVFGGDGLPTTPHAQRLEHPAPDDYDVDHAVPYQDAVTVTANDSGGKAFWQPCRFAPSADVLGKEPL